VTPRAPLAAALAAVSLAACTSKTAPSSGNLLTEPSSVAVFRGVTTRSGVQAQRVGGSFYRPYIAIANAGSNDLSIVDGVDDSLIEAPAVTRGLVYPAPGRPLILAAGDLGDALPDLLVVVTAGELPWEGSSQLRVVRTWRADGSIVDRTGGGAAVDLGADVLGLLALPTSTAGAVTLVAALADERIATVKFTRKAGDPEGAIDVDAAQATVLRSAPLGFRPLAIAAIPGDATRVFAASTDPLPGGIQGVARIDVAADGTPSFGAALNAHAPTRLVAAGRLREALPTSVDAGAAAFDLGSAPVERVWAIPDESSCGIAAAMPCGLLAIDVASGDRVPAFPDEPAGWSFAFRAPIPIPGYPLAMAFGAPPALATDPQYAGTFMAIGQSTVTLSTTGVVAVAAADGFVTYVDAARWNVPTNQAVVANVPVKATNIASTRPSGTAGGQWLTLFNPTTLTSIGHADTANLAAAVGVTAGYTPSDTWIVQREGKLPGLDLRRAEWFPDGTLAMQVTTSGGVSQVVRLWDPTLGVSTGDIVVIEPVGLGTCGTFEASVAAVNPPDATHPGGSVTLGHRPPTVPKWDPKWNSCVDLLRITTFVQDQGPWLTATIRAGGYVLVRGTGSAAVHVGRPEVVLPFGKPFVVAWNDGTHSEQDLAAACPLPPSVPWQSAWETMPPASQPCGDGACRDTCMQLQKARLARRVRYLREAPPTAVAPDAYTGPALAFTLALAQPTEAVPRDLTLVIGTAEGSAPYRVTTSAAYPVDPRQVLVFDRSPWTTLGETRFLVPWAGSAVLDTSPSFSGGGIVTIH
jgi:hypothetical protein